MFLYRRSRYLGPHALTIYMVLICILYIRYFIVMVGLYGMGLYFMVGSDTVVPHRHSIHVGPGVTLS